MAISLFKPILVADFVTMANVKVEKKLPNFYTLVILSNNRGAFGKFLAWSYISVTDLQTLSCVVSF